MAAAACMARSVRARCSGGSPVPERARNRPSGSDRARSGGAARRRKKTAPACLAPRRHAQPHPVFRRQPADHHRPEPIVRSARTWAAALRCEMGSGQPGRCPDGESSSRMSQSARSAASAIKLWGILAIASALSVHDRAVTSNPNPCSGPALSLALSVRVASRPIPKPGPPALRQRQPGMRRAREAVAEHGEPVAHLRVMPPPRLERPARRQPPRIGRRPQGSGPARCVADRGRQHQREPEAVGNRVDANGPAHALFLVYRPALALPFFVW